MNELELNQAIAQRMQNPNTLQVLLNRLDKYGESILKKTIKKIAHSEEIASTFGFNPILTSSILIGCDLSTPCYGRIGERFLQEIDSAYNKEDYGHALITHILNGLDVSVVNQIADGVKNVIKGVHTTPEEQIALMINVGREFADTLKQRETATIFLTGYKNSIIKKTANTGILTEHIIPENDLPRRNEIAISNDEEEKRLATLKNAHKFFIKNPSKIPENFRKGWGNISQELLVAYYVVGTDDKFLERFEKKSKDDKEDTEVEM